MRQYAGAVRDGPTQCGYTGSHVATWSVSHGSLDPGNEKQPVEVPEARAGTNVVITNRGKPVARLTLVEPTAKDEEAQAIRRINALPWVRPGKGGKPKGAKNPIPWKPGDKLASDRVIEDRI